MSLRARCLPLLLPAMLAGCQTASRTGAVPIVQPGAPGEGSTRLDAGRAADLSAVQVTAADVQFMQAMIAHHAQAVAMTALVPERTTSESVRMLAQRIDLSQADEIRMMEEWLRERGHPVPAPHAHHAAGAAPMPGMLTPEEMGRLERARGPEFDRLFLELMIKHHEGALYMVQQLFEASGAAQDSDVFAFVSDVEADQRMEIARMRAMLAGTRERGA